MIGPEFRWHKFVRTMRPRQQRAAGLGFAGADIRSLESETERPISDSPKPGKRPSALCG